MVEQFFSVEYSGRSDLFENLKIWEDKKYRNIQGTYPVISLSFANVKEPTYQLAEKKICELIAQLYVKYDFITESGKLRDTEVKLYKKIMTDMEYVDATLSLYYLSGFLYKYYGKKVIILLDEYDTPMQEAFVDGYWEQLVTFTRSLFNATFKTNPALERGIMTGITRVSKESIFSDLNNLKVVTTTSNEYAASFGFTEQEVFSALESFGLENEKNEVKRWYDGFIFGTHKDIYNPWSILNYLDVKQYTTYWANTSANSLVGKLVREGNRLIKEKFEKLLCGECIWSEIDEQIVYNQLDGNEKAVWSLLLAGGYLKVLSYEKYQDIPEGTEPKYQLALTNLEVKLPFRVDFTFRFDISPKNADEGIRIHFGNYTFAVNEGNNPDPSLSKHAIIFNQPIFGNQFVYPDLGKVKKGEYNSVSWIIGEKQLAVIINGEVRFCAENLPYMKMNFEYYPTHPILINGGGDMPITIKKIVISQLEMKKKTKVKKGELMMITRQSNNAIQNIQTYCVGERGENFSFDGACEQLMECLGEKDLGYWLIAGITGDCYAQVYPKNRVFFSDRYSVSDYHILYQEDCSAYMEGVFNKMGYACTYVPKEKIMGNKEMYRQTLMAYIDKGVPVIHFRGNYSLICGYEEHGNIFLEKRPCNNDWNPFALDDDYFADEELKGWIFIGEKKEQKKLADVYRDAVLKMPETLTTETKQYYFGAKAFLAWAEDIEKGFYDGKTQDEVDLWGTHTSFVCDFETISATSGRFLSKALELNPDLSFLSEIIAILGRQGPYAIDGLEDLGGGFNVTLAVLQDKEKRKLIADRLRIFAKNMDEIVRLLNAGIKKIQK